MKCLTTVALPLVAASMTLLATPALAQSTAPAAPTTAPAGDLPAAATLISKSLEAMGGEKKLAAIKDLHIKINANTPQGAITIEQWRKGDKMFKAAMTIQMMGMTMNMGRNGDDAWQTNPMSGATERVPVEQIEMQSENGPSPTMLGDTRDAYKKAETIGMEQVGAEMCYKVKFSEAKDPSPQGDNEIVVFLSQKTNLPIAVDAPGQPGQPAQRIQVKDYKKFGDFMFATKMIVPGPMGQDMELTFEKIALDELDEALFALPADLPPAKPAPTTMPAGG